MSQTNLQRPLAIKCGGGMLGEEPSISKVIRLSDLAWTLAMERSVNTLNGRPIIFVFSAFGGVTNELVILYDTAKSSPEPRQARVADGIAKLKAKHHNIADHLFIELDILNKGANKDVVGCALKNARKNLDQKFIELETALRGLLPIGGMHAPTDSVGFIRANVLATGEMLATTIMREFLPCIRYQGGQHWDVKHIDATKFMVADTIAGATCANLLWEKSTENIEILYKEDLKLSGVTTNGYRAYLTEGFVAASDTGTVATLRREGSDLTAVLLAGHGGTAVLLKELDGRRLKEMSLQDLLWWQIRRNSHLIGRDAIETAIARNVTIVIYDMSKEKPQSYHFRPAKLTVAR